MSEDPREDPRFISVEQFQSEEADRIDVASNPAAQSSETVTEPSAEGIDAPLASSASPTVGDESGRVDNSKAWDMAHASKDERKEAAWARENIADHGRRSGEAEAAHRKGYLSSDNIEDWRSYPQRRGEDAAKHDQIAEEIEHWAGILHDHPVSEAYKASHPGVEFEAYSLVRVAKANVRTQERLTDLQQAIEKSGLDIFVGIPKEKKPVNDVPSDPIFEDLWENLAVSGFSGEQHTYSLENVISQASPELIAEWENLRSNRDTTIGQLMELHQRAMREVYINPLKSEVAMVNAVLEDVRTGRASEQTVPEHL